MAFYLADGFAIIGIHTVRFGFVLRFLTLCVRGNYLPMLEEEIAQFFTGCGVVGNDFRNNILRAGDSFRRSFYFFGNIFFRFRLDVKRFINCNGCARFPFLFIRAVNIFHFGKGYRFIKRSLDFFRHFALFGNRFRHFILAFL